MYTTRRDFLRQAGVLTAASSLLPNCGLSVDLPESIEEQPFACGQNRFTPAYEDHYPATSNEVYQVNDRGMTASKLAYEYNNFYEFTLNKTAVCESSKDFPTYPWELQVEGLVENPQTLNLDEIMETFTLEERVYRFRCVERWAMVVPWSGFPLHQLIDLVQPTSEARFVRFTSFYDPSIMISARSLSAYPWPYTEGLRMDEARHDLCFLAVGLYGAPLPPQNGAPIRMVVPWKYGYKGAKSLVKIEFVAEQPDTFWNTLAPNEYPFESNVDPGVPHPRWSQAMERLLGESADTPTLKYNGYAAEVASLYES